MAPGIKTQHPRNFDDAKLAAMVEPLTIRVEKIKGSSRTPIPLPEGDDGKPQGTEWSKEDVRGVENWIVTQWAGGGLYEITVTDSSVPPAVMKWSPFWSPADYPEMLPPPLAAARAQNANPTPTTPTQQVRQVAPAFPNGLPTFPTPGVMQPAQQQWYPQPQQPYFMPPPLPAAPQPGSPQWAAWQDAAEKRKLDEELRALRDQAQQRERDALNAKHEAQLNAERQTNEQRAREQAQQLNELRNMITQLSSQNQNQKNPELEAMRLQMEQQRQQFEAAQAEARRREEAAQRVADEARREADSRRREQEMKDLMKATQDAAQRQVDELKRQMEQQAREQQQAALLAAQAANKQDPMIPMFMQMMQAQTEAAKEAARQNAEAIKEVSRNQATQMASIQATMMTPMQAIQLAKENASQTDAATQRVQQFFGSVVEMQQKVMENALQMQPSGSPVPALIEKGIDTVQSTIERYVGAKSTEERVKAQAQASIVESQSRAYIASQQAATGQTVTPSAPQPQQQLNGPAVNNVVPITNAKPKRNKKKDSEATATPTAEATPVTTGDNTKRLGRTDDEWFGPLLSEVDQLRIGIDRFMESMSMDPPRLDKDGHLDGISAEMAAAGILQAVTVVMHRQVAIPAMVDLLFQKRYADFMDVLIPNAPQTYRDDTAKLVIEAFAAQEEGDDEDGDDEDGDGDEDGEGEDQTPPPSTPSPNGRASVTH